MQRQSLANALDEKTKGFGAGQNPMSVAGVGLGISKQINQVFAWVRTEFESEKLPRGAGFCQRL